MQPNSEFPRCVYGPEGATKTIMSEDERPDGWVNNPKDLPDSAKDDAEKLARKAEAAAKRHRNTLIKLLDEHKVKFSPEQPTNELEALAEALKAHLAKQGEGGGNG